MRLDGVGHHVKDEVVPPGGRDLRIPGSESVAFEISPGEDPLEGGIRERSGPHPVETDLVEGVRDRRPDCLRRQTLAGAIRSNRSVATKYSGDHGVPDHRLPCQADWAAIAHPS